MNISKHVSKKVFSYCILTLAVCLFFLPGIIGSSTFLGSIEASIGSCTPGSSTSQIFINDGTMADSDWTWSQINPSHPATVLGFQPTGGNPGSYRLIKDAVVDGSSNSTGTINLYATKTLNPATNPLAQSLSAINMSVQTYFHQSNTGNEVPIHFYVSQGNTKFWPTMHYAFGQNVWITTNFTYTRDQLVQGGIDLSTAGQPIEFGFTTSHSEVDSNQIRVDNFIVTMDSCQNVTPPVINCSTNAQCGTNGLTGSPFCQSNGVYKNYTTWICNNPGTANSNCTSSVTPQLQSNCSAAQTCSNGSCTAVSCNANSDCGTNGLTGSLFCQGNGIYQNYTTWTCNSPGTSGSHCSSAVAAQLQNNCSSGQTCSNGSCNNNNNACTSNYQQNCVGSSIYWFNSCGVQQGLVQTCPNGCSGNVCQTYNYPYCTYHSYQSCAGNAVYWYDSCGTRQDIAQSCPNGCSGNSCQNYNNNYNYNYGYNNNGSLSVISTVKNLTFNTTNWANSVYANPGDTLMFMITLNANGNQDVQNVFIKDTLPVNLIYNNQVVIACTGGCSNYNTYGNIVAGINLNTISAGQTITITYQAQVAGAQSFAFGTTTLSDNVYTTSSNSSLLPSTNASVVVTRAGVLGASTVSTGLTNNFLADSFFLPLMLALFGLWMWKKKKQGGYDAEKELTARIARIRKLEG